jgi:hypothetical protein
VWRHERKTVLFFCLSASSLSLAFTPCKDNIAVWTLLGRSALWNSCKHEHTDAQISVGSGEPQRRCTNGPSDRAGNVGASLDDDGEKEKWI